MRSALLATTVAIGVVIVGLLFRFGTASPCGILKQEMRAQLMQSAFKSLPTDTGGLAGVGLGMVVAGSMVDNMVGSLTPLQCTQGLIRLYVKGENIFGEALQQPVQGASTEIGPFSCEACVDFRGRSHCATVTSATKDDAIQGARNQACDSLVTNTVERLVCTEEPPTRVACRQY